jgi:hypothetical protein
LVIYVIAWGVLAGYGALDLVDYLVVLVVFVCSHNSLIRMTSWNFYLFVCDWLDVVLEKTGYDLWWFD